MKALIAGALAALLFGGTALAQTYVQGYTKKDGTYVAPHYRSSPNSTTSDNYSTRGNVNPYTGAAGTKPDTRPSYGSSYSAPSYPSYSSSYGSSYSARKPASSLYGTSDETPSSEPCTSIYDC